MSGPWTSAGSRKYAVKTVSRNGEKGFYAMCWDNACAFYGPYHFAGKNATRERLAQARAAAKADLDAHRKDTH